MGESRRILVTGATGFVGTRLCAQAAHDGLEVIATSRNPDRAKAACPDYEWRRLDVESGTGLPDCLEGISTAYYLIHAMGGGGDYAAREKASALAFRESCEQAGVGRIVYLGGVEPSGPASHHLRSRLQTGEILRDGKVPCIELRAGMIVGHGSLSWKMVRDLSARLPVMVLPRWLKSRSQPVGVGDVIHALLAAGEVELDRSAAFSLPGPETLTAKEILMRVAGLKGHRPWTVDVPVITPRLSSHWIRFVTSADPKVARELVEGLRYDLIARTAPFWPLMGDYLPQGFDAAAEEALYDEQNAEGLGSGIYERIVKAVTSRRKNRKNPHEK